MDEQQQIKPEERAPTLPPRLPQRRGWRRRYGNARAVVALIVLASFVGPGIAAVIGAVVAAW